ncbi:MAG TPA: alpha/beta hydrolase [Blastocatellia bacterium]|nr:alpha/beta hydrolase [Blastocatellia bacterium]
MKQKLKIALIDVLAIALIFIAASVTDARADHSQKSLSEAQSHYTTLDGSRVHYKSLGRGDHTLIFIHGWTCNMDFWRSQVPGFTDKTRVIAIDLPGHGQSDKPKIDYTMDLFARAVDAVMRDAKVEKAVLVGHSMGAPVIRQFYRKYPQKTLALVIVDGGLRPFGKKEQIEPFLAMLRGPNYKETVNSMVDGMLRTVKSAELRQQIKDSMLATPQHVVVSAMEGMMDEAIYKPDKINAPVLTVLAKSPTWQSDTEQFFRSLAPNLDYHMMEDVSHFLMMEKPAEFNAMLSVFLVKNGLMKM